MIDRVSMLVPVTTILLLSVAPLRYLRGEGRGPELVQEEAPCTSSSVLARYPVS